MRHIRLTQGNFAIVDDEDYEFLGQWKWYARHSAPGLWYALRRRHKADGPGVDRIYMHRVVLNPPEGLETDHVNGDGLDNRRANLRAVTNSINLANQTRRTRNRVHDLPMGVSPSRRKFLARIGIDGHQRHLGTFDTPEEASAAYQAARQARISRAGARQKNRVFK